MGKRETAQRVFALTCDEMHDVLSVKDGADIRDFRLASRLRVIDAKYPGLLVIVKPQHKYDVREKLPYFGCILNPLAIFSASVPMAAPEAPTSRKAARFSMLGGSVARGGAAS